MASSQKVDRISMGCSGGFLAALAILFIYLKLTEVIDWSWWWILAPLWIPVMAVLGVVLIGLGILIYMVINQSED